MFQAYANERFDRIQQVALDLTDKDRAEGRPAPYAGYSEENWRKAEEIVLTQAKCPR